jgi:N-acetylglucosamine-6-sulfatase
VSALVSNQDIAPTLLGYAGAGGPAVDPCASPSDCRRMDGRSLEPLLGGPGTWSGGRGVLAEIDTRRAVGKNDPECDCAYEAIRTHGYLYAELATGERELYDLQRDPFELQNQADAPAYAQVQAGLAQRLALLEHCSGVQGRDPPTAAPFCE